LKSRDFWVEVNHPELSTSITYHGAFAKLSQTPITIKRRAPLIGEHNLDIYQGELGLSRSRLAALQQAGVI
jgi:formyl-CoA transferase